MSVFHPFPAASIEDLAFLRMQAFHDQRVSAIADGKTFLKNTSGGILVVHVIPKCCVLERTQFEGALLKEVGSKVPPLDEHSSGTRFTADGFMNFSGYQDIRSYSLLLRDGRLEAVLSDVFFEQAHGETKHRFLRDTICEGAVCKTVRRYQRQLQQLHEETELWMFASLVGCIGTRIHSSHAFHDQSAIGIDRSPCILPEILLPAEESELNSALRGWCDTLWQACGKERSFNFDEEWNWQPRR
jgi:hypothetical protein